MSLRVLFRSTQFIVVMLTALIVAFCHSGCAHFSVDGAGLSNAENESTASTKGLPPVEPPTNSVQLELVFIERPVGDLVVNNSLWNDLDEVTAVSHDVRSRLRKKGFLTGHAGTTPPRSLQGLLGMSSNNSSDKALDGVQGRRLWAQPGKGVEIQASGLYDVLQTEVQRQGQFEPHQLKNARCVIRLTAVQLENGWATLEFLPELHHGEFQLRTEAGEGGWEMRTSQNVERFFDLRFRVTLNTGEMAVLASDANQPESLGGRFFMGSQETSQLQRVLVVRLADVRTPKATMLSGR